MTQLILAARVSSATTKEVEAKRALLEGTKQLGIATMYMIQDVKAIVTGKDIGNKFESDFQVCYFLLTLTYNHFYSSFLFDFSILSLYFLDCQSSNSPITCCLKTRSCRGDVNRTSY